MSCMPQCFLIDQAIDTQQWQQSNESIFVHIKLSSIKLHDFCSQLHDCFLKVFSPFFYNQDFNYARKKTLFCMSFFKYRLHCVLLCWIKDFGFMQLNKHIRRHFRQVSLFGNSFREEVSVVKQPSGFSKGLCGFMF